MLLQMHLVINLVLLFTSKGCSVVLHVDGCRKKLTVQCSETSDSPNYTEQNAIRRSAGPQQPAKGPLALVRRQIAKYAIHPHIK